jgi:tubulin monoglycylase TTLL15
VNLDKYVVGDDYLPLWEVPSLKKYYTDLHLGMRESFNTYLRAKGRDPDKLWQNVRLAVQEVILKKEPLIVNLIRKYPFRHTFFELTRLDFVLDSELNPYLMEANLSPNLSSSHFYENRFIYEQVLYNLFSLIGLAKKISSSTLGYRTEEEKRMEVSDKVRVPGLKVLA